MKNNLHPKKGLGKKIGVAFIVAASFITLPAQAALSAAVAPAFTQLQTDALALVDMAWSVAIPVAVAFIILRLFKKAASSAT